MKKGGWNLGTVQLHQGWVNRGLTELTDGDGIQWIEVPTVGDQESNTEFWGFTTSSYVAGYWGLDLSGISEIWFCVKLCETIRSQPTMDCSKINWGPDEGRKRDRERKQIYVQWLVFTCFKLFSEQFHFLYFMCYVFLQPKRWVLNHTN